MCKGNLASGLINYPVPCFKSNILIFGNLFYAAFLYIQPAHKLNQNSFSIPYIDNNKSVITIY
jgi:hypothetical protein